ncbi:MAG: tetratricopeptide repeat protein [Bryobacteraceae bacterium]
MSAGLLFLVFLLLDPQQSLSLLQKGLLALEHGQIEEARQALEQASAADPRNAYVWSSLAETYFRLKEPEKAEMAAAKAEQVGGTDPVVSRALEMFYFSFAQELLRSEDFTRAAEVLKTALKAHPKNAQLTLALGVARYGQRRFEDAIEAFLEVIRIDPSIEQPYMFLGRVLDQAGPHLEEITKDYEAWVARDPQSAEAQLLLAKALLASDSSNSRSETLLRRSIARDSKDWESHYELGILLASKHRYKDAAAELTQSIELDPKQPMPHYHLARVYDRLGEPDRAQAEREAHQRLSGSSAH